MRAAVTSLLLALAAPACGPSPPPAPPFAARGEVVDLVLPLLDGGEVAFPAMRGKVVVVHFFATWSVASDSDLTELRAVREAVGDGVALVSIALDKDGYKLVAPWRDAEGVDWLVALTTPEIVSGQSVFGDVMAAVPATVLLDADGAVAWAHRGPLPPGELTRRVTALRRK